MALQAQHWKQWMASQTGRAGMEHIVQVVMGCSLFCPGGADLFLEVVGRLFELVGQVGHPLVLVLGDELVGGP